MAKPPYMPSYPDNNLAQSAHLPLDARGALREIYDYMWLREGWLLDDDKEIARLLRISQAKWQKIKPKLATLFVYIDGRFTSERLLERYAIASEKTAKCRKNGKLGAEAKRLKNINAVSANGYPDAPAFNMFGRSLGQVVEGMRMHII